MSQGQTICFQNLLVWNYKALSFRVWYVALSRGPIPKLFKLCSWGQNWPRPGYYNFTLSCYNQLFLFWCSLFLNYHLALVLTQLTWTLIITDLTTFIIVFTLDSFFIIQKLKTSPSDLKTKPCQKLQGLQLRCRIWPPWLFLGFPWSRNVPLYNVPFILDQKQIMIKWTHFYTRNACYFK